MKVYFVLRFIIFIVSSSSARIAYFIKVLRALSCRMVCYGCLCLFLRGHMGINYPQSSFFLYYGKKRIHKIYHLNHSSVHSAVALTTRTLLYSKSLELCSSCKTETLYHVTIDSSPSSSQALATTTLLSKRLTVLGLSGK